MALPPGIASKTVRVGIASFFDGSLAEGTATITAPINAVHGPTNRPIFSSQMSHRFVDGETSFNLCPTDADGLNNKSWTYKLNVVISGALVQPEPVYFTLPSAGPDEIDLDSLVTVPSSAGTPIQATVVTSVNGQTGDVTVAAGGGTPADGSVTPAKLSFDPATQAELDALASSTTTALGTKVNSSTYTAGLATKAGIDDLPVAAPTVLQSYYVKEESDPAVYSFPSRLRPAEPTRKLVRIRNRNTVSCQLAYSVNNNGNANTPAGSQWTAGVTLAPGQAAELTGQQAIFCRPLNNNGADGLKVSVETYLAVS